MSTPTNEPVNKPVETRKRIVYSTFPDIRACGIIPYRMIDKNDSVSLEILLGYGVGYGTPTEIIDYTGYTILGGCRKEHEEPIDCAIREFTEETCGIFKTIELKTEMLRHPPLIVARSKYWAFFVNVDNLSYNMRAATSQFEQKINSAAYNDLPDEYKEMQSIKWVHYSMLSCQQKGVAQRMLRQMCLSGNFACRYLNSLIRQYIDDNFHRIRGVKVDLSLRRYCIQTYPRIRIQNISRR